ncbi:hypothetical protein QS306_14545 [Paraburkholderia bonniea]|uniref:hypothetical protein n=1 Tax=Paraburkholderia bonniea TaxID=2152891 RepID=UPI001291C197|nr:hypothetical protein [Paraburkholderia bonniea]WJF91988.1 hypothetical protein QS306_14545 [Paraburkholderia bonniea]WJF95307.1 hypothetical protein QS308_14550 [Paraburkholderia bonniea]
MSDADMDNVGLNLLCVQWAEWHRTRKFYAPPPPRNVLARLHTAGGGAEPDALADRDMMLFNAAVSAQPDDTAKAAFHAFYLWRDRPAKRMAGELGMTRDGFYKAMKRFRVNAYTACERMKRGAHTGREQGCVG